MGVAVFEAARLNGGFAMLTVLFLVPAVLIIGGFLVWITMFGGGRKGQSGKSEVNAQHLQSENKRSS